MHETSALPDLLPPDRHLAWIVWRTPSSPDKVAAVLAIRRVAMADTHFGSKVPVGSVEKALWDRWSRDGTLLTFAAEWSGVTVGLAVAASHPRVVGVLCLETREHHHELTIPQCPTPPRDFA
jgi:hypothetical protein